MKKAVFALLLLAALLVSCATPAVTTAPVTTSSATVDTQPDTSANGGTTDITTAPDTTADASGGVDTPPSFSSMTAQEILNALKPSIGNDLTTVIDSVNLKDKSTFSYHFFVQPTGDVKEAAICQPIIGTIPFFLGILKTSSADAAKTLAASIKKNVDPRKLVCATYEHYETYAIGDTVVLVMDGDATRYQRVCDAILSLAGN
ncbi:MAG: hypothetical protein IJW46_05765 [Clostridia bacterium]|nr:hypothetical protein [Clostridia bacterium]